MLHVALIFLCTAQIIHFTRHWLALTAQMRKDNARSRLNDHLDWSKPGWRPRVGSLRS